MTLLLNNDAVRQVLTMKMTLDALDQSYHQMMTGEAVARPRVDIQIPTADPAKTYQWGTMEGGSSSPGYFAIRMKSDIIYTTEYEGAFTQEKYCVRPGLFCGLIFLFDVQNAEPLAIINDGYLQHFRVGADAGIGARYLAREDAAVVGMLGSGGMARSHLEALLQVRKVQRVQVYSPTPAHREAYAQEMAEEFDLEVVTVDSEREAHRGADIVCGCTDTRRPVIMGEWLEPGCHVTDVGGGLDRSVFDRVDVALRLGTTPAPVGLPELTTDRSFILYRAGGEPQRRPDNPAEGGGGDERARLKDKLVMLEDLLAGRAVGRTSSEQITFSTRGNIQGAQFFAVAGAVYQAARAANLGQQIPTEWFLQDIRD